MASVINATNLQRVEGTLEKFVGFLEHHQWVARVNTVGFFTEKMWDRIIMPHFGDVARATVQLTEEEMARLPAGQVPSQTDDERDLSAVHEFIQQCVERRLENTDVLCELDEVLNELGKEKDCQKLSNSACSSSKVTTVVQPRALMNPKKSHEVEEMSSFTARLAEMHQLQKIVDIGSGKGYLGQYLAHQYGLDVTGIDSSDSNTHGAQDRNNKLLKKWKGISRHSMNTQRSCHQSENPKEAFKEILTKRTHKMSKMQQFVKCTDTICVAKPVHTCKSDGVMNRHEDDGQSGNISKVLTSQTNQQHNVHQAVNRTSDIQNSLGQSECLSVDADWKLMNMQQIESQSSGTVTAAETTGINVDCENTLIEELQKINIYSDDEDSPKEQKSPSFVQTSPGNYEKKGSDESAAQAVQNASANENCTLSHENSYDETVTTAHFCSVTAFVEPSTSLTGMVSKNTEESHQENEIPFMLIGLHTCGDLAPSTLRLFIHNDMARVLLNVGCCYQHLSEEFEMGGWNVPETKPEVCGFPMSNFLRSKGTKVTRPARMLASMAADRIATSQVVPAMGLFYRSVLQVLLQDHYRLPTRAEQVGKLAPKCRTFLEYARKALKKLQFDDSKLSDAEITAYSDHYQPYFRHLQVVNQLRVALSPTVEGLLMLDRLCYLQEQTGVRRAAVVRLFDPVTSPRCYAILATR